MFYQILRSLREKDGLSQTRFAQEIGFSQAAISAWENNTREPGIEALMKIAKFFNISVDYLVGNNSKDFYKAKPKNETPVELTPDGKELIHIFNSLDADYQAQILEYARYFASRSTAQKKKS